MDENPEIPVNLIILDLESTYRRKREVERLLNMAEKTLDGPPYWLNISDSVKLDGNCLFSSIEAQLERQDEILSHIEIRQKVVDTIKGYSAVCYFSLMRGKKSESYMLHR